MKINQYILLLLLSCTTIVVAQKSGSNQGDKHFNNLAYASAIEAYLKDLNKTNKSPIFYRNLADSYYHNAKLTQAAKWYKKYVDATESEISSEHMYRYAIALKAAKNYTEADKWLKRFLKKNPDDIRAQHYLANKNYLARIEFYSGSHTIKNEPFNTAAPEFAPAYYGEDQILFSSVRDTSGIASFDHLWTDMRFTNLFLANRDMNNDSIDSPIRKLSKKINSKYNESSAIVTKDGNTMFFTRNNYTQKKFRTDEENVNRLKLYKASMVDGKWSNVEELPFNSNEYSIAHPALGPDEKRLYFASDMPGTFGLSDIFYVDIYNDDTYSEPVNLGKSINTEARETYPFISESGKLYIASDGHVGLGGLDIFVVIQNKLKNLGSPINSSMDDFAYIINESDNTGYFTSNRKTGKGSDDIYSFKKTIQYVEGTVTHKTTQEPIPYAFIEFRDQNNMVLDTIQTNSKGYYKTEISPNTSFNLLAFSEGYSIDSDSLTTNNENQKIFIKDFQLSEQEHNSLPFKNGNAATKNCNCCYSTCNTPAPLLATDNSYMINGIKYYPKAKAEDHANKKHLIEPIYFDLDKDLIRKDASELLDRVVSLMSSNSNLHIEIHSFCDSRNSNNYNDDLSARRAKNTIEYLIQKGISSSRLNGKAFGESGLVNNCKDNKECNEQMHQLNRRSEFIIIQE